jgi:predicted secreted Zn-dependent protease
MPTRFSGPHRQTYTVSGTLEEVAAFIGAREEAGKTEWPTRYNWRPLDNGTVAVDIDCDLHIEMPHWDGYAGAPPADQAAWDAFFAALTEHEDGHVWIVHSWLDDSDHWLAESTDATVDADFAALMDKIQHHSDEFDALTDHGINRGCVINLGGAAATGGAGFEEGLEE